MICKAKEFEVQLYHDVYVLNSPHFLMSNYPDNVYCTWKFTATASGVFVIKLGEVLAIDTFDILQVGKGSTISNQTLLYQYPIHHRYAPLGLLLYDPTIWLVFISDHYGTQSGFYLLIEWTADIGKGVIKNRLTPQSLFK